MTAAKLFKLPKLARRIHHTEQTWWSREYASIAITLLLSGMDAVTLYGIFERLFYENQIIVLVLVAGCSLTLNFLPLVLAYQINLYKYKANGVKLWQIVLVTFAFCIFFGAVFMLRWNTRSISFSGLESSMVDTTGQISSGLSGTDPNSGEAIALTVLLGVSPLITSIVNFMLALLFSDPVKRRTLQLKIERARLDNYLNICLAARTELDQDWTDRLTQLETERLRAATTTVQAGTNAIETLARLLLAEKLAQPDQISYITEQKLDSDSPNI